MARGIIKKETVPLLRKQAGDTGTDGGLARAPRSVVSELGDLFRLMVPIFVSMVSWVGMKTTDTALVGHLDNLHNIPGGYLAATALSDLWTSSTGVFVQGRVLGIFCGNAWGAALKREAAGDHAGAKEARELAGAWLQVSLAVLFLIAAPVAACWLATAPVLTELFREGSTVSDEAGYFASVLALCLPARIVYSQLSQFFQAQRIMHPGVVCGVVGMLTNLTVGLPLVLGIPLRQLGLRGFHGYGFTACPWVTVGAEVVQLLTLYGVYVFGKGLHRPCWPGWSVRHLTLPRIKAYVKLYVPAALAIASDFWRMAFIGAVAAHQGSLNLAVFNASYRVLWMCLIFTGSMAAALGIKMSMAFGAGDHKGAKFSAKVGSLMAVLLLGALALLVALFPRPIASIFTSDPEVLDEFVKVRLPLAATVVTMNLANFLEKIPMAMGRTQTVLYLGLIGSWVGQVPGVLLATHFWRDDLIGLYTGVAAGYLLLCVLFQLVVASSDWAYWAQKAAERAEEKKSSPPPPSPVGPGKGSINTGGGDGDEVDEADVK